MLARRELVHVFKRQLYTKPYYVTTPIFYVNAEPHIGHLYSMILADVIGRWHQLQTGGKVMLVTGTDEHGLKVEQAAARLGRSPGDLTDLLSGQFRRLADSANVRYSRFIRTSDADHVTTVQEVWNRLQEKGFIYKGEHSGWYCVADESFCAANEVQKCPASNNHVLKESGRAVDWTAETNYFFALSKIQPLLREFYQENTRFLVPASRREQALQILDCGVSDLSISRPTSRSSWGVSVPNDSSQIVYVWMDALMNYLAAARSLGENVFPPDLQILGKDIFRFHAIYWPAFLLAADLPLPRKLLVHNHWTSEGSKMSKTLGNVVDPMELLEHFQGSDGLRYFLMRNSSLDRDSSFDLDELYQRHNVDLANKYANLVMRVCGPKFSIHESIDCDARTHFGPLIDEIQQLKSRVSSHMDEYNTAGALQTIFGLIMRGNLHLNATMPWKLGQDGIERKKAAIKIAAEICRVSSILLQPFVPDLAARVLDRLNVDPTNRSYQIASFDADSSYGVGVNRKGDYPICDISRPSDRFTTVSQTI